MGTERMPINAHVRGSIPGGTPNAVLYTPQELDEDEQAQARENIGALGQTDLSGAVDMALEQAKESGEFEGEPGKPGTTPHIGANGNWYIGDTDTGVKAAGSDASVTEANIRNALGYTPADAEKQEELEVWLNDVAGLGAVKPIIIETQLDNGGFVIQGRTLDDILSFTVVADVTVHAYSETEVLIAKLYPNSMGVGNIYKVRYVDTGSGAQIVPEASMDCVVYLTAGDKPYTVKGMIKPVGLPEDVKTEIAEQAAGLVDMALLAIIGEVTE